MVNLKAIVIKVVRNYAKNALVLAKKYWRQFTTGLAVFCYDLLSFEKLQRYQVFLIDFGQENYNFSHISET